MFLSSSWHEVALLKTKDECISTRDSSIWWTAATFAAQLHNTSYAAHLGVHKTASDLLEWVWCPNLAVDVKHFVAEC